MKHITQVMRTLVALLVASYLLPAAMMAQVKWVENFDYPVGNLLGQGDWGKYGSNPNNPIQVVDEPLTYAGYPGGVVGKSVKMLGPTSSEDLMVRFEPSADGITSGNLYYSALIRVDAAPTTATYSLTLLTRNFKELAPGGTGGEYGRLFFNAGADATHFQMGVERGSTKPVYAPTEYEVGKTYLVVVKYAMDAVMDNEKVSLYVNPTSFTEEPAAADAEMATGTKRSRGFQGFELRQGGGFKGDAPTMLVGSLRISDTYAGLFTASAVTPEKKPTLSLPAPSCDFGPVYQGVPVSGLMNVKGANLKGDVTVTVPAGELTVTPTTLPAAQLMSAEGVDVTLTLSNPVSEAGKADVVFSAEGMADVTFPVTWNAQPMVEKKTLAEFKGENADLGLTYRYTGKAVVTFVDKSSAAPKYYVQDSTAGMVIQGEGDLALKEGDALTNVMGTITSAWGVITLNPLPMMPVAPVESGVAVAPVEVTLAALKATPADYLNRLVKVTNVTFQNVAADATFAVGMTQPVIKDATGEGKVRIFKGTSLIGTAIPTEAVDLVGLSTSTGAVIVGPRGAADIISRAAPSLEVTPLSEVKMEHGFVGKQHALWTLRVKAVNLPGEVTIESTGKDRAMFTPSVTTLPAGSSEMDIVITYAPTKIGKHSGRVQFDCVAMPTLSKALLLAAYATDEKNPPAISVTPNPVPEFAAKVDEVQEQTITVKTAFLPDFGKIALKTADAFRLSTTMLLKDNEAQLKVTFTPNAEGTYENALILSALGADTLIVPIVGKAAPSTAPEPQKEGDVLPLDTTNALTLLQENFDTVEKNKVLSLKGWKNLAMVGQRAWWGMEFGAADEFPGEKAAKITPYDSKMEMGVADTCEMMLVTPALDFVNAKSKIFTFRVRGDYLRDNQPESLELCYIDMAEGQLFIQPINVPIPAQKDLSGEWNEFHVDLTNNQLADVFFMGFRFKGFRGRENSATYYIDDVSFGRTDLPVVLSSTDVVTMEALPSKDAISEEITITTRNLVNPVKLSIGGPNRSKFALTTKELPAEGGSFQVKFNSDQLGVHEAYVKLSSRGAADKYVMLAVNCVTEITGIESVTAESYATIRVFDAAGRLVRTAEQSTVAQALSPLASGTYLVQLMTANGVVTKKIQK